MKRCLSFIVAILISLSSATMEKMVDLSSAESSAESREEPDMEPGENPGSGQKWFPSRCSLFACEIPLICIGIGCGIGAAAAIASSHIPESLLGVFWAAVIPSAVLITCCYGGIQYRTYFYHESLRNPDPTVQDITSTEETEEHLGDWQGSDNASASIDPEARAAILRHLSGGYFP